MQKLVLPLACWFIDHGRPTGLSLRRSDSDQRLVISIDSHSRCQVVRRTACGAGECFKQAMPRQLEEHHSERQQASSRRDGEDSSYDGLRPRRTQLCVAMGPGMRSCTAVPLACSECAPHHWQDWWIWQNHAQYRKEPGFFVDLASNDAMWASNTYFLEQCLGWRGLCIEPNPVHHERIRAERKCTLVPNCVSDAAKTIEMILPDSFHGGAARVVKQQSDLRLARNKKPVQMECRTLRSILHEHKVKHIDFMSLDIEGHEPEAMSTLKLDHGGEHGVTIDVVSAETNSSAAYWRAGNYRHYSPEGMEQVFLRPGYQMPIEEAGKPILWPAEVPTCSAGGRRRLAELVENTTFDTTLHPKHSMA